jgi:hypothetical protein
MMFVMTVTKCSMQFAIGSHPGPWLWELRLSL